MGRPRPTARPDPETLVPARERDRRGSSWGVLVAAERRLVAAIEHRVPRPQLVTAVGRLRRAQLGHLKSRARRIDVPTELDDQHDLARQQAVFAAEVDVWQSLSVDEIIARYTARDRVTGR